MVSFVLCDITCFPYSPSPPIAPSSLIPHPSSLIPRQSFTLPIHGRCHFSHIRPYHVSLPSRIRHTSVVELNCTVSVSVSLSVLVLVSVSVPTHYSPCSLIYSSTLSPTVSVSVTLPVQCTPVEISSSLPVQTCFHSFICPSTHELYVY